MVNHLDSHQDTTPHRRAYFVPGIESKFRSRLGGIVGSLHVALPRIMTAEKAREILDLPEPFQKRKTEGPHLEITNAVKPKQVDGLRRKTQRAAREASGIWEGEEPDTKEKKVSTPFPVKSRTEAQGVKKSIRPNKDWPPQIQKTYLALQQIGAQFKIVQTNAKQRQLALVVPEDWINPKNGSLQVPEASLKKLKSAGIKTSERVEDDLLYFYRALRIGGNKKRRLKEKRYEKNRQKIRRQERRLVSQTAGIDEEDGCKNTESLAAAEERKASEATLQPYRNKYRAHSEEQGIDPEEVEAILAIASKDLLEKMMACTENSLWRDPEKDWEWKERRKKEVGWALLDLDQFHIED